MNCVHYLKQTIRLSLGYDNFEEERAEYVALTLSVMSEDLAALQKCFLVSKKSLVYGLY